MSDVRHFAFAPPIDSGALFWESSFTNAAQVPADTKLVADPIEFRRAAEFEAKPVKHCFEPGTFVCLEC
ncbi:hypothetical protein SAMN02927900_03038 [Rhizobium mongolense subsp. loessense]|uniref:Uncharacterized protein n=1 Tax=Rhizobium mongolense subsp. loessense TaxID=158890 RepID=A0A1G4RVB3_9HYPH|nr:hypothetical protein [Rhizobium mongolense]SCW60688.1 hypothetical protein SAMN02927900_03038 [Rhizobium mongolense subsp. loessense]